MKDEQRYFVTSITGRVSAEFDADGYTGNDKVILKQSARSEFQLEFTPGDVRRIAKALVRAANMLDPPKPRVKRGAA